MLSKVFIPFWIQKNWTKEQISLMKCVFHWNCFHQIILILNSRIWQILIEWCRWINFIQYLCEWVLLLLLYLQVILYWRKFLRTHYIVVWRPSKNYLTKANEIFVQFWMEHEIQPQSSTIKWFHCVLNMTFFYILACYWSFMWIVGFIHLPCSEHIIFIINNNSTSF